MCPKEEGLHDPSLSCKGSAPSLTAVCTVLVEKTMGLNCLPAASSSRSPAVSYDGRSANSYILGPFYPQNPCDFDLQPQEGKEKHYRGSAQSLKWTKHSLSPHLAYTCGPGNGLDMGWQKRTVVHTSYSLTVTFISICFAWHRLTVGEHGAQSVFPGDDNSRISLLKTDHV